MNSVVRILTEEEKASLVASFPMLLAEEIFDSPLLEYRAISVWEHWLYLTAEEHLIDEATVAEKQRWIDMFKALNRLVAYRTPHVFMRRSNKGLAFVVEEDLEAACEAIIPGRAFVLLLPELGLIYTSGDNDLHTRVTYRLSASRAEPFDVWVRQSGLQYVRQRES